MPRGQVMRYGRKEIVMWFIGLFIGLLLGSLFVGGYGIL
jgi:hypothetical protein